MREIEIKVVIPHSFPEGWEVFEENGSAQPYDDFGWFAVDIGFVGEDAANIFDVLVTTSKAIRRAKQQRSPFKGLVVDCFLPSVVWDALHEYVSSVQGNDWDEVVERLREKMFWEYEGM